MNNNKLLHISTISILMGVRLSTIGVLAITWLIIGALPCWFEINIPFLEHSSFDNVRSNTCFIEMAWGGKAPSIKTLTPIELEGIVANKVNEAWKLSSDGLLSDMEKIISEKMSTQV